MAATPFTDWMRMGTIGTGAVVVKPASRAAASTGARWSGWMSKRTRFGLASGRRERRSRSRLCWTRKSVSRRNAPKPRASTTATVWFAGRCRLARPCRQT